MSKRRAPFIVVEGLDRSGKTTQTTRLVAKIESLGLKAKLIKFPDRTTTIGQMIDSYLKSTSDLDDCAVHLLFSANRWELARTIETYLETGVAVICDRYAFSGIAFSAAKVDANKRPLLTYEWCRSPDVGLPAPDLVLFFDITPEKGKERGGYGEERYEKEEMQMRVRQLFHKIGEEIITEEIKSTGKPVAERWKTIDAGQDIATVEEEVWSLVKPLVSNGVSHSITKLWVN